MKIEKLNKDNFVYRIEKASENHNNIVYVNQVPTEYDYYIELPDVALGMGYKKDGLEFSSAKYYVVIDREDFLEFDYEDGLVYGFYLTKEQFKPMINMLKKIGFKKKVES